MSEHLVIRLPAQADQKVFWLIWSVSQNEIIGSGELAGVSALSQLTETAAGRTVKVLVPVSEMHLRRVEVDNKVKRQLAQALPYMLEEELASDVEQLHFAQLHDEPGAVVVAIVEQRKMDNWLTWLDEASLVTRQMMPDVLALPQFEAGWSALQLENEWLIRTGFATGVCAERDWLGLMLEPLLAEHDEIPVHLYSEQPEGIEANWQSEPEQLPMQILAEGAITSRFNLLQGEYQPAKEYSELFRVWRRAGIAVASIFLLMLVNKGAEIRSLSAEREAVRQETHHVFKVLFPDVETIRDTRIRAMVKQRLDNIESGGGDNGFLAMVAQLSDAFNRVPEFKPDALRYDQQRGELRLTASAKSFQQFEQFKSIASEFFEVEQGSLTSKADTVSGILVIKGRS